MTVVVPVSADWLALREPADARARSRRLALEAMTRAARAAEALGQTETVVHDLGSGTGSMMRWLATLPGAPRRWVLHDWNATLLERAEETPGLEVDVRVGDLALLAPRDLAGVSLVTMSALLDVLTRDELDAIVAACVAAGVPILSALSVTGRVELDPVDGADRVIEGAFNDHQRRTTDGRRLLGPDAVTAAIDAFQAAGWHTETAASSWRLDAADRPLVAEWLAGWLDAAVAQRPDLGPEADGYARRRAAQSADGALRVVVHHTDFLAWPP